MSYSRMRLVIGMPTILKKNLSCVWIAVWLSIGLAGCGPSAEDGPAGQQGGSAGGQEGTSIAGQPTELGQAAVCPELEPHPIAASIAEDFDTEYDQVIEWFCGGHTFEDILLALQTERLGSVGAADLLAERSEGKSWDVVWAELGITTR
ncbi:MAG: hypothetical protein WD906_02095 [Anaerolineales bacterium]